jgi:hypothetical protein
MGGRLSPPVKMKSVQIINASWAKRWGKDENYQAPMSMEFYVFSKGHEFFVKTEDSIGGQYWKALFFEYTDGSFTIRKAKDEHLGFLGPVIRAEVADTIKVTFKNKVDLN